MKKLLLLFAFLSAGMFLSCNKDDASGDTITLTSDLATHYIDEAFVITVKTKNNTDVSSAATIYVNDAPITGRTFSSSITGTFRIKAIYSGMESKVIEVAVIENPVPLTSISTVPNTINAINGDEVTFSVTGNNSTNLTSKSTIYVNGVQIQGNGYRTTEAKTLAVYSTYVTPDNVTLTSETTEVAVSDPIYFKGRVLIEDYTGTWCGFCPRVAHAIDLLKEQNTNFEVVAIHTGDDPFIYNQASTLEKAFGIASYPTGKLNRTYTWEDSEEEHLDQVTEIINDLNPVGLAMNTTIAGTTATVTVNVKFGQNFSDLKLVVYAVEDKLISNQTNYTTYYGGASVIKGFESNNVLRKCLTENVLGDKITGTTNVNNIYTKTFTYAIPSNVKADNVRFIAFVENASNKVLNVRGATNNENQTFEIE